MGTITRGTKAGGGTGFNSGQTINPAEVNTDFDSVYTEFNGNVANVNIKTAAAIALTKIAHSGARVYNSVSQNVTDITATALTFDSERYDTDAYHSITSLTTRLTIPSGFAGKYALWGNIQWAANAVGVRQLRMTLNGTTIIAVVELDGAAFGLGSPIQFLSTVYTFTGADYIELIAHQTSGGTLAITSIANFSPEFSIAYLGA